MLKWAFVFLLLSIVAGVFGFTGIAAGVVAVAKFLFFGGLVLFLIFLALGLSVFRPMS